ICCCAALSVDRPLLDNYRPDAVNMANRPVGRPRKQQGGLAVAEKRSSPSAPPPMRGEGAPNAQKTIAMSALLSPEPLTVDAAARSEEHSTSSSSPSEAAQSEPSSPPARNVLQREAGKLRSRYRSLRLQLLDQQIADLDRRIAALASGSGAGCADG